MDSSGAARLVKRVVSLVAASGVGGVRRGAAARLHARHASRLASAVALHRPATRALASLHSADYRSMRRCMPVGSSVRVIGARGGVVRQASALTDPGMQVRDACLCACVRVCVCGWVDGWWRVARWRVRLDIWQPCQQWPLSTSVGAHRSPAVRPTSLTCSPTCMCRCRRCWTTRNGCCCGCTRHWRGCKGRGTTWRSLRSPFAT